MNKILEAFFEFKNEASITRKLALGAVVIITIGVASLSVTGIVATAHWTWLSWMPILGIIIAVLGAEALATVAFIRTLTAPTRLRKVAGFAIFLGLAAVGVHNAENGAHVVWPERFVESSASLSAKSDVSQKDADRINNAKDTAIQDAPGELDRVRDEIAKLEVFTRKMSAQTPEGIKEAQSEMIPRCGYTGRVDGIRNVLTESAMRSCGEQIRGELATLKQRETNLLGGQMLPIAPILAAGATPVVDPSIAAIDLDEKARAAFWAWFWLILMLCVLEAARSLSLWALITDLTGAGTDRDRQRAEELAELEHQNRLAALRGQKAEEHPPESHPESAEPVSDPEPPPLPPEPEPQPKPEPVVAAPEPAPEPPSEAIRGRAGGLATGHVKGAAKAKNERLILVPSLIERDAELQAAKVAAQ